MPVMYKPDGQPVNVTDKGVGIWSKNGWTTKPATPSASSVNTRMNTPGYKTVYLDSGSSVVVDDKGGISQYGGQLSQQQSGQFGTKNQEPTMDAWRAGLADEYKSGKIKNIFDFKEGQGTQWNTGESSWSPFAVDLQTAARNQGQMPPMSAQAATPQLMSTGSIPPANPATANRSVGTAGPPMSADEARRTPEVYTPNSNGGQTPPINQALAAGSTPAPSRVQSFVSNIFGGGQGRTPSAPSSGQSFGTANMKTGGRPTTSPGTPGTGQDWINNPKSGFGGMEKYSANNIARYHNGEISYESLQADSNRLGYAIPPKGSDDGAGIAQKGTTGSAAWIEANRPGGMANYAAIQRDRYKQALATNDVELINKLNADAVKVGYSLQDTNTIDKSLENPGAATTDPLAGMTPEEKQAYYMEQATNEFAPQLSEYERSVAEAIAAINAEQGRNSQKTADQRVMDRLWVDRNFTPFSGQTNEKKDNLAREWSQADEATLGGVNSRIAELQRGLADFKTNLSGQVSARAYQLEQDAFDRNIKEAGVTNMYNGKLTADGEAQQLENEINRMKLANMPQEITLGLEALKNDVATGKLNLEEAKYKLNELKDPNSVTNKAAKLELEMKQLEAKYLPQEKALELSELKKRIAQIGAKPAVTKQEAEMKSIALEKARISLDKLKNGEDKPKAVDNKASTDLYSDLLDDFSSTELTATAKRQKTTEKDLARSILRQNKDFLTDSDYKNLNDYINKL